MTALWKTALERLSDRIAPQNFDMWLRPIQCCAVDGHTIRLRAPNPYVRLWFESNYLSVVLDELRTHTSIDYHIEFIDTTAPQAAGEELLELDDEDLDTADTDEFTPLDDAVESNCDPHPPESPVSLNATAPALSSPFSTTAPAPSQPQMGTQGGLQTVASGERRPGRAGSDVDFAGAATTDLR